MSTHDRLSELMTWLEGGSIGVITVAQTTYFEFVIAEDAEAGPPRRGRVHYKGKVRQSRIRGAFADMVLSDEHPLLIPYEADTGRVAFHRGPRDGGQLLRELHLVATEILQGWVSLEEFLNPYYRDASKLTADAHGQLMSGPMTLVSELLPVLSRSGMEFRVFESRWHRPTVRALTMGRMHVVASHFRGEVMDAGI